MKDLLLPLLERIFNSKIEDSPVGVGFAHKDVKHERHLYDEWDMAGAEPRPKGDE